MVHYNAYITGEYNALYTPTNHGFFIALLFSFAFFCVHLLWALKKFKTLGAGFEKICSSESVAENPGNDRGTIALYT